MLKIERTRLISASLILSILTTTMPIYAVDAPNINSSELSKSGQSQTVPVTFDNEGIQFSVTVPSSLPIYIDRQGQIMVAEGAKVVNRSGGPVEISNFEIEAQGGFNLVDYDSFDTNNYAHGDKSVALRVGNVKTTGPDSTDFNKGSFNIMTRYDADGVTNTVDFTYDAKVPAIAEPISNSIANITFILDWASDILPTHYIIQVPDEVENIEGVYQLGYGDSYQLSAIEGYDSGSGTWSSSRPEVVDVDSSSGVITAVGPGTATIYYTKDGLTGSIQFKVTASETVSSIEVASGPNKTTYHVGDNFDSTGLSLKVTYDDGRTEVIDSGFTVEGGENIQLGTDSVTIRYGGATCTVPITIEPIGVKIKISPSVSQSGGKYQLTYGETYNLTPELVYVLDNDVQGTWTSDNPEIVSVDQTSGIIHAVSPGSTIVRYTKGDLTGTIDLQVKQSTIPVSMTVKTPPTTVKYYDRADFNSSGLVLEVKFTDGHTEDKSSGFAVLNGTNLSVGTTSITVTYTVLDVVVQCDIPITVLERPYDYESVNGSALKKVLDPYRGDVSANILSIYTTAPTSTSSLRLISETDVSRYKDNVISAKLYCSKTSTTRRYLYIVPSSKIDNMEIGHLGTSELFKDLKKVTKIDLSGADFSACTWYDYMFAGTESLQTIIPGENFCKYMLWGDYMYYKSGVSEVDLGSFDFDYKYATANKRFTTGNGMFYDMPNLKKVSLGNNAHNLRIWEGTSETFFSKEYANDVVVELGGEYVPTWYTEFKGTYHNSNVYGLFKDTVDFGTLMAEVGSKLQSAGISTPYSIGFRNTKPTHWGNDLSQVYLETTTLKCSPTGNEIKMTVYGGSPSATHVVIHTESRTPIYVTGSLDSAFTNNGIPAAFTLDLTDLYFSEGCTGIDKLLSNLYICNVTLPRSIVCGLQNLNGFFSNASTSNARTLYVNTDKDLNTYNSISGGMSVPSNMSVKVLHTGS